MSLFYCNPQGGRVGFFQFRGSPWLWIVLKFHGFCRQHFAHFLQPGLAHFLNVRQSLLLISWCSERVQAVAEAVWLWVSLPRCRGRNHTLPCVQVSDWLKPMHIDKLEIHAYVLYCVCYASLPNLMELGSSNVLIFQIKFLFVGFELDSRFRIPIFWIGLGSSSQFLLN